MKVVGIVLLMCSQMLFGWGSNGHKIINKNAVNHLPVSMQKFIDQQTFLEQHSTDADTRRTNDTAMFSEQYRHYLDVDDYPDFTNLSRNFSTLVGLYGWKRVKENGTNTWELVRFMDSLTAQLKRGDWNTSYQTAADIGHYAGDPHQPLHAAANYNGQLTGNTGIHSRYETSMINANLAKISVTKDTVEYISDIYGFAFRYILKSNSLVDSILHADNIAKAATAGSYTTQYYDTLWQRLGEMTKAQIQSATINLASLWYTAWVNAGLLDKPASVHQVGTVQPKTFSIQQNFPNPFNPSTTFRFSVAEKGHVRIAVYSLEGKEVAALVNGVLSAGTYDVRWEPRMVPSGVYFYRMESNRFSQSGKLIYIK